MTKRDREVEGRESLARLMRAAAEIDRDVAFMEVCGTHTVAAFRCGLHSVMPSNVRLLSGPGCPVCVTDQSDIDMLVDLAKRPEVVVCTYGDMVRVPGMNGSLESARSDGADVRVIYSAMDTVRLAEANRDREIVFASVGFETTTPGASVAILKASELGLRNYSIIASHKLVVPAMRVLLDSGEVKLGGFLCPGHVSVIIGAKAFAEVVEDYSMPCVVAGFEPWQIAGGVANLTEQVRDGVARLVNLYTQAVSDNGNVVAWGIVEKVFELGSVKWRALGELPNSGMVLRGEYRRFDAREKFEVGEYESFELEGELEGCRCGEVITGRCEPRDCGLFGVGCTPMHPVGPCMVSSEGSCQAWFKYGNQGGARAATTE